MYNAQIDFKTAERVLRINGFRYDRTKGSHYQFVKDGKRITINRRIKPCVWYRIVKDYKLIV